MWMSLMREPSPCTMNHHTIVWTITMQHKPAPTCSMHTCTLLKFSCARDIGDGRGLCEWGWGWKKWSQSGEKAGGKVVLERAVRVTQKVFITSSTLKLRNEKMETTINHQSWWGGGANGGNQGSDSFKPGCQSNGQLEAVPIFPQTIVSMHIGPSPGEND